MIGLNFKFHKNKQVLVNYLPYNSKSSNPNEWDDGYQTVIYHPFTNSCRAVNKDYVSKSLLTFYHVYETNNVTKVIIINKGVYNVVVTLTPTKHTVNRAVVYKMVGFRGDKTERRITKYVHNVMSKTLPSVSKPANPDYYNLIENSVINYANNIGYDCKTKVTLKPA